MPRWPLSIDTHDGRVRLATIDGRTEIETHDGTSPLTLSRGAGFDFRADCHDDDLRVDVDLSPYRIVDDDGDEGTYEGSIRGGGPRLSFTAHDGSFDLRTQ